VRVDRHGTRVGRIVEVEAYGGPEDRASHARFGPTARTATMFGAAGRAYVYGVYGMHTCLNVVTGPPGEAAAVLVRAVEPLAGLETMRAARLARALATRRADRADPARAAARIAALPAGRLADGPANVAAAFDVTRADDGADLLDPAGALHLEPPPNGEEAPLVRVAHRVGVAYAGPGWADRPWRFVAVPAGEAESG
jgi:DNA-3-methyladenine glycosylase